ncbi:MAG: DNA-binding response regulator [Acidobacteria bacterium]|nr:MAG: DNA-binding response regulator [Acidobacteriota bacterium]PYV00735.1 MAG: DNA-binding response regulator [Acidobacteriota bacterium]PYV33408.1 MAG: DNA-binding response regulator [Acidobacteriota bacterium]
MASIPGEEIRILLVDDEPYVREIIRQGLEDANYKVEEAGDGKVALEMIRQHAYDVIITDLRLPGVPGEKILQEALSIFPETIVIIMTGFGNIQTAVDAIRMGAYDYLPKPFQLDEMVMRVKKGLHERRLKSENTLLRSELQGKYQFSNLIGNSSAMQQIYSVVSMVAQKTSTILITGETGTGKELIARAIHYNGPRKDNPFVGVNCGAIPSSLLEDELFGHVKGAFTGAHQHRIGRFEQANNGTLFLDEAGTMPLDLQVKLLRVLQEKEFQRVGGTTTVKADARIIAATNMDLLDRVRKGEFREDLYYRLNVIPIRVMPLRQRREDVPLIVTHFVKKYCAEQNLPLKRVSHEAIKALVGFEWPGNVRQLENAVEMAVALSGDRQLLDLVDFPMVGATAGEESLFQNIEIPEEGIHFNSLVEELERRLILQSLQLAAGNKRRAASLLHLKRTTLVEKLKRMGLENGS